MARSKSGRKKQARDALVEKGITATVMGVAFLIAPAFAGNSPILRPLFNALQSAGWIALVVGISLLGIHFMIKSKSAADQSLPRSAAPSAPSSGSNAGHERALTAAVEPRRRFSEKTARRASPTSSDTPPRAATAAGTVPTTWNPQVFAAIEWRRFEAVCETLFAQAGFKTTSQSHGADGGVDVWLYSANAEGPAAIAQCKHWRSKQVGVKEMREFFGVMASHQLKRGTYATTSTFTTEAVAFAKANGINGLDGAGLLRLIGTRTAEQQKILLDVAFEGDYWRPTCASCGIKTVERSRGKTGEKFWGCSNYPKGCKTSFPITSRIQ